MRSFLFLLSLALLLCGCELFYESGGEPPTDVWTTLDRANEGLALALVDRGDLLIAGTGDATTSPLDGPLFTPSLTRISHDGRVRWTHVYEPLRFAEAKAALLYGDSYVMLISRVEDAGYNDAAEAQRVALWRVDPETGDLRDAFYDRAGSHVSYGTSRPLLVTRDGGLIVLAQLSDFAGAFAVKLDASGSVAWEHTFPPYYELNAVAEAPDGGLLIAGTRDDLGRTREAVFLRSVGNDGTERWTRTYGSDDRTERGFALAAVPGGYVVAGMQVQADDVTRRAYVLRVDEQGEPVWEQRYGEPFDRVEAYALGALPEGGLVLVGYASNRERATEAYLAELAPDGTKRWTRTYGWEGQPIRARAVLALDDGSLAVVGSAATSPAPFAPPVGGALFFVVEAEDRAP